MRIDLNPGAQPLPESSRSPSQSSVANASAAGTGASSQLGEDQAQLSGAHAQVQSLVAQALQLPEIRQEKVNALRQAMLGGSYQPSSEKVAEGLFTHLVVERAA
jgi:flagellar biosynthesis anti-sigma factor FlgM